VIAGAAVFLPLSVWRCPEVWADLRETLGPAVGRRLAALRGRGGPYLRPGLEADGG
jgi:hypothetical protein